MSAAALTLVREVKDHFELLNCPVWIVLQSGAPISPDCCGPILGPAHEPLVQQLDYLVPCGLGELGEQNKGCMPSESFYTP